MLKKEELSIDNGTVLIVEDELITSMELETLLQNWGFNSIQATSGEESLELALQKNPEIILMDIKLMGFMDGIEAAKKISKVTDVPIIYLTAYTDDETIDKAKKSLPFAFLSKPVNYSELRFSIELALIKYDMEKKLKESEEKYRYLADNVNDVISIFYLNDGTSTYISPSVKKVLGYDVFEISNENFFKYVHPEDRTNLSQTISLNDSPSFSAEFRILKKDGTYLWVETSGELIVNADPKLNEVIAVTRDISRRKYLEMDLSQTIKEKNNLIGEMNHRIKNNLMTISSLLNLQSQEVKHEESKEALIESKNRANSMALIYKYLQYSDDQKHVKFDDYLSSLIKEITTINKDSQKEIKYKLEAAEVYLDVNIAIPVGIIINELITNVFKHAFPPYHAKKENFIHVLFSEPQPNIYTIKVIDNGIGIGEREFETTETLGLNLVKNLVNQIKGDISIENNSGTRVEIKFKDK